MQYWPTYPAPSLKKKVPTHNLNTAFPSPWLSCGTCPCHSSGASWIAGHFWPWKLQLSSDTSVLSLYVLLKPMEMTAKSKYGHYSCSTQTHPFPLPGFLYCLFLSLAMFKRCHQGILELPGPEEFYLPTFHLLLIGQSWPWALHASDRDGNHSQAQQSTQAWPQGTSGKPQSHLFVASLR